MPDPEKDAQDTKDVKDTSGDKKEAAKDDPIKALEQKFASWTGRLEAQQKQDRETIKVLREELAEARKPAIQPNTGHQDSAMKAMDDKWAERILQGDVAGVLEEYTNLRRTAEEILSRKNVTELDMALSGLEEKNVKYIKEVKDGVRKVAASLLGQGYSPQDAVAFAYEKARADHLDKLVGSSGDAGFDSASLETSTGGSKHEDAGARKGKLNSEGKKAWEKNKTYFKDEAEFIATMSPRVRERFVG